MDADEVDGTTKGLVEGPGSDEALVNGLVEWDDDCGTVDDDDDDEEFEARVKRPW